MPENTTQAFPVQHVAQLSNIPITDEEAKKLESEFAETLQVIADLKTVDVSNIPPTFQVTGLENILREDVVDERKMFTQEQALANAPKKHEGFFVVSQVINQD